MPKKLLNIANADAENLYIKTDGSLDDGLELVTHPMTLTYRLNEMPWAAVLHKAQEMDYLSPRRWNLRSACAYLASGVRLHL